MDIETYIGMVNHEYDRLIENRRNKIDKEIERMRKLADEGLQKWAQERDQFAKTLEVTHGIPLKTKTTDGCDLTPMVIPDLDAVEPAWYVGLRIDYRDETGHELRSEASFPGTYHYAEHLAKALSDRLEGIAKSALKINTVSGQRLYLQGVFDIELAQLDSKIHRMVFEKMFWSEGEEAEESETSARFGMLVDALKDAMRRAAP